MPDPRSPDPSINPLVMRALPAVPAGELHDISSRLILQPGPAALTDGRARLAPIADRWQRARPPG